MLVPNETVRAGWFEALNEQLTAATIRARFGLMYGV